MSSWKAENIGVISLENETKVLARIKQMCCDSLNKYPQTLKEDIQILAKDDANPALTFN